jgi:hypothetical protein
MARPRKAKTIETKTITLQELEKLWGEYLGKRLETPIELSPNYHSYCKRNPSFWYANKEKRLAQLQKLHLIETTTLDWYENNFQPQIT